MSDPFAPAPLTVLAPVSGSRQADARSRVAVADIAVGLSHAQGYEATSAAQIAAAAGVSRSTFFRQFRSKDDVIFADHDELLEQIGEYFTRDHDDPWLAVCEAAGLVFERFRERLEVVRVRDRVVRRTSVQLAAAVTATHNFELRRMIRATDAADLLDSAGLVAELRAVRRRFAPASAASAAPASELLVAVFPASALPDDVARAIAGRYQSGGI